MRLRGRTDHNQSRVAKMLRRAGASVLVMSGLGDGAPDLAVGFRGANWFLEVKDGAKKPSARQLTPLEDAWHRAWRGQVAVVNNEAEALAAIGLSPL